jgi:hypothetical protein
MVLCDASPASALEEQAGEKEAIQACDRRLCTMLVEKNPKGGDLTCALTKTWAKSTIKGANTDSAKWDFGDARCSAKLELGRAAIVSAVTEREYKLYVPLHAVDCVVEQDGRPQPVKITVAPRITFKDGKAQRIWINLRSVDGPAAIKATLWTAAKLEDSLGAFQRSMIKSVTRFIERHCPNSHAQAQAAPDPAGKAKSKTSASK